MNNKILYVIIGVLVITNILSFFVSDGFMKSEIKLLDCDLKRSICEDSLSQIEYNYDECIVMLDDNLDTWGETIDTLNDCVAGWEKCEYR